MITLSRLIGLLQVDSTVGDLTGNKIQPIFKTENYEITYENVINDFNKVRSTNSGTIDIQTAIKNGLLDNVLIQNKAKLIVDNLEPNIEQRSNFIAFYQPFDLTQSPEIMPVHTEIKEKSRSFN